MKAKRNFGSTKKRLAGRRKRATKQRTLDPNTPAYWDGLLGLNHLSMERGNYKWLSYGHTVTDLDFDGVRVYQTVESILEQNEWPISLC